MATNEQILTTKVLLNSEQAQNEIKKLEKKVDDLKKKRDEAWKAGDTKGWEKLGKEISKTEASIRKMEGSKKSDSHFSEEKNQELVNFCRGTGLRRSELTCLTDFQGS